MTEMIGERLTTHPPLTYISDSTAADVTDLMHYPFSYFLRSCA